MGTTITKGENAGGRAEKVEQALAMLAEGVERITGGEEFRRYLALAARFHRYSARNCLLILAQRPDASRVAGYRRWQEMGRQVRRGEEGIRILAPISRAVEDEATGEKARALVGFKTASVFDVAQTDGEALPEAPRPEDLHPDDPAGVASRVYEGLSRFCQAEGVALVLEDGEPGEYGRYERRERRVVLNRALPEVERAATLAHELAHHLLHQEDDAGRPDKATRETEAEGVSFAVFAYFGFDTSRFTFAYVARYAREPEVLTAALERIQKATHRLIEAVEGEEGRWASTSLSPPATVAPGRSPTTRSSCRASWWRGSGSRCAPCAWSAPTRSASRTDWSRSGRYPARTSRPARARTSIPAEGGGPMAETREQIRGRRRELIRSAGEPDNRIDACAVAISVDDLSGEVLRWRIVRLEMRGRSSRGPLSCGVEEVETGWRWWVDPAPADEEAREALGGLKGGVVPTHWQALEELPELVANPDRWEPGAWMYAVGGGRGEGTKPPRRAVEEV